MNERAIVTFAVIKKNGIVTNVGRSTILQPKTNFKGESTVKWYKDTKKRSE
ncbi:hypothetical protein GN277_12945 [Lachnospiraceae bacterium WCA-9-b2]|jgi:hypothetical protein|uniref:Uncharacterized protein n=1 Tax=Sporofaciens musculi TaxID=2681861 RepID=A0A7X3SJD1_9FIRM|nr:hypothetical protein [Sporofaciens musculi]MCI9423899.1 hypothetical protein [Dorea sp.]MXP76269.1 hypothetical protein [Sporofaciens musculi]